MDLRQIQPVDHARAAQLAMAVNLDDDAMAALVANDVAEDERSDSALLLMLAQAQNVIQLLHEVIGPDRTATLLHATLAQHVAAEGQP